MRSSRSVPDQLDPGAAGFAHRGLHYGSVFPENSLIAFAAALELGAGIECDLRLTADNHIVVFHDPDAWRMCASPMRIGISSLKDLTRLRVGEHSIPTLPSVLSLVSGRVPLLLEVKVDRDVWRWMPALKRDLAGYDGRFGLMSFDPRIPRLVKTNMPEAPRGLVVEASLAARNRWLFVQLADPQFIAVEQPAIASGWVTRLRRRMPVYGWTIATAAERLQAGVHADSLIWEADGRPGK